MINGNQSFYFISWLLFCSVQTSAVLFQLTDLNRVLLLTKKLILKQTGILNLVRIELFVGKRVWYGFLVLGTTIVVESWLVPALYVRKVLLFFIHLFVLCNKKLLLFKNEHLWYWKQAPHFHLTTSDTLPTRYIALNSKPTIGSDLALVPSTQSTSRYLGLLGCYVLSTSKFL